MKLIDLHDIAEVAASVFTSCVIGGGAPRDLFLGGPVKDIDLFVDTRADVRDFSSSVHILAAKLCGEVTKPRPVITFQGGKRQEEAYDVATVDIVRPSGPPVQVIPISRNPFDDVFAYDFGISQILVTAKGVLRTAGFDRDVADHTITYLGDETWDAKGRARSALRLQRLRAKYPGRALVNCEILQQ